MLPLAEVADDVAEVEEERRRLQAAGGDVLRYRVGDARLMGDRLPGGWVGLTLTSPSGLATTSYWRVSGDAGLIARRPW